MESISTLLRRALLQPPTALLGATDAPSAERAPASEPDSKWLARFRRKQATRALPADLPERERLLDLWAQGSQWLHYRDGRAAMAETFLRSGRGVEALEQLLEVWYIDLNGPRNAQPPSEALLLTEAPPFDARQGATRAHVRRQVRHLMAQLRLEVDDIQALYFAATTTTHRRHGLPLSPAQAWLAVAAQLLE